jgi:site-specific DNA recombinase
MKAIIFARVSTEEQKEAGNSLPAQLQRLKNYCTDRKYDVIKSYNIDESAWKKEREKFKNIVEILTIEDGSLL